MKVLLVSDRESRERAMKQLDFAENVAKQYSAQFEASGSRILKQDKVGSIKNAVDLVKASQHARVGIVTQAEILLYKAGYELL